MAFNITARDNKMFSAIAELGMLTNEQVRKLCYPDTEYGDKCSRRRTLLFQKNGFLVSFSRKQGVGRKQKVFAINKRKKREVADIICKEEIMCAEPKSTMHLEHQLEINNFAIDIINACEKNDKYKSRMISDLKGALNRDSVKKLISETEYLPYMGKVSFIPDLSLCIENSESKKKALMFCEIDRDNLTLRRISGNNKNVETKLLAYNNFWESKNYKRYDKIFDYAFSGFKLLWVCLSKKRIDDILRLCKEQDSDLPIWFTTTKEVSEKGVFAKIWTMYPDTGEMTSIVKEAK